MAEIKYQIYKHIGSICKANNGWIKELNYISWNDREPVYDLRTWNEDHTKMGKGITITADEMMALKELIEPMRIF